MYEYVSGRVEELSPAHAVLDAGGIGYYLIISLNTYSEIEKESSVRLYVHFVVREDAQIMYGFADKREREIFRMLLGVSGVGGNTARMILSTYSPDELVNIISSDNAGLLKNVKGLGMKTAQKIIVELRDKMMGIAPVTSAKNAVAASQGVFEEAVAALTMLGFPRAASEKVLRTVMAEYKDAPVEDIIRYSLKKL